MNNKRNKLLIAIALISFSTAAFAFGPYGGGPERGLGRDKSAFLAQQLELSDEQQQKISDIMKSQREEAQAFREKHRQQGEEKISQVLNEEQLEKFKQMKQQGPRGMGKRGRYGEGRRFNGPCAKGGY